MKKILILGLVILMIPTVLAIDNTNLLHCYSGEISVTNDDYGSNDLSVTGSVGQSATAKLGSYSMDLAGTADYLTTSSDYSFTDGWCVNMWVNFDNDAGDSQFLSTDEASSHLKCGAPNDFLYSSSTLYTRAGTGVVAWDVDTSTWNPETGQWYMLTFTWEPDTYLTGWVNGAEVNNGTVRCSSFDDIAFRYGAYSNGNTELDGKLDDISVWSSCSKQDILDLYNSGTGLSCDSVSGSGWSGGDIIGSSSYAKINSGLVADVAKIIGVAS